MEHPASPPYGSSGGPDAVWVPDTAAPHPEPQDRGAAASRTSGPASATARAAAEGVSATEDTLDLDLSGELAALVAGHASVAHPPEHRPVDSPPSDAAARRPFPTDAGPGGSEQARAEPWPGGAQRPGAAPPAVVPPGGPGSAEPGLLGEVADGPPVPTPYGAFQLVPVRAERDLPLISRWMNDPAVAAFWELDGPVEKADAHLRAQLDGDGRSVPCLGLLDGLPMSYWELYRADLDPLARYYPARPHDTGVHLLIGGVRDRGRGVGTALLRAAVTLVFGRRPRCTRVVAEPDLRNVASVAAFLGAGFRFSAELELPLKRAALMVCDRGSATGRARADS